MIDNDALAAILQEEERQAASYRNTELAGAQEVAIKFYEAMPFGDEEDGRSQLVSPDVAETVDYMTISVLRTCVSGDQVVEFEAKEEVDEESATEATEAVNYTFMRGQDGYKVMTDWLQAGLIEKIGVIKTTAAKDIKRKRERFELDENMLSDLMDQPGVKVLAATQDEQTGAYMVEVEQEREVTRFVDMPIPSEEFLFSARLRDVDDMGYKCHRTLKFKSDLIEMGFDRDTVEQLPAESGGDNPDSRHAVRWADEGGITVASDVPGLEQVWLCEEYVNIDLNDDGVAELIQVFRVDRTVLQVQEVEENPFVVFTPFPRAHRMVGTSLADKVMDIQRARSVVLRQTMDGMYLTNSPRMWVPDECQTANTIDDLLTVRPGGLVRGRGAAPTPLHEPFDVSRGVGMLQYFVGERESRTGITRLNQGLDADAVNKTATGTALMQAQGQQYEEYIARNFAEALARLFLKKLRLMIAAGDPVAVRIEGGYKQADPKTWNDDLDVSIRVGLGSGRKDQRLAYRGQLLQMQQLGLQNGLITPAHLYANMAGWIRDAALGNANDYWQDPNDEQNPMPPQEPQPDPKLIAVQAKAQADAAETDRKAQADQANAMLKAQIAQLQLQQKAEQAQMEAQMNLMRMDMEASLAREKQVSDLLGNAIKDNRPGGSLAE